MKQDQLAVEQIGIRTIKRIFFSYARYRFIYLHSLFKWVFMMQQRCRQTKHLAQNLHFNLKILICFWNDLRLDIAYKQNMVFWRFRKAKGLRNYYFIYSSDAKKIENDKTEGNHIVYFWAVCGTFLWFSCRKSRTL